MAVPTPFPHDGDRSLTLVRYLDGDLAPAERQALELHLVGCEECRKDLALSRKLFPAVDRRLREDLPSRSPAEIVAILAAAQAKLAAERPTHPAARLRWPVWALVGTGIAAAATALVLERPPPTPAAPTIARIEPPSAKRELAPSREVSKAVTILLYLTVPSDPQPKLVPTGQLARVPRGAKLTASVVPGPDARYVAIALVRPGGKTRAAARRQGRVRAALPPARPRGHPGGARLGGERDRGRHEPAADGPGDARPLARDGQAGRARSSPRERRRGLLHERGRPRGLNGPTARESELEPMRTGFVMIKTALGRVHEVARALIDLEEVSEVHSISGPHDLLVKIVVASYEDFATLVPGKIQTVPGIVETVTFIAFNAYG